MKQRKLWKTLEEIGVKFHWQETAMGNTKVICADENLRYRKARYIWEKSDRSLVQTLEDLAHEYCMENSLRKLISAGSEG